MIEQELRQLYEQSLKKIRQGEIVRGKIAMVKGKEVFVDVGFKSEGIVAAHEFTAEELVVGRELSFLVESLEDDSGMIVLSRDKAKRMQGWEEIIKHAQQATFVEGRIVKKVKGGFLVDVMGAEGFLPASLSALKGMPEKEILSKVYKFKIVKVNNLRRSLILSRREVIQKEKTQMKERLWQELKVGDIRSGVVKAVTDFGAFIDLGGIDGLLHITDMSWSKISHPSEVVALQDKIEVVILNIDKEASKVSLGLKQRFPDPWQDIEAKYPLGSRIKGKVVNILKYGIFVELEKGVEGLVHISEISWAKRISNLGEMFAIGDTVEVCVLSVDKNSRRISLSIKQLEVNPWLEAETKYPVGVKVTGRISGFTDYGAFVELGSNLEGMIHISDISWTKRINHPQEVLKKGQKVEALVLSVDAANRRIGLGLKQLQPSPWPEIAQRYPLDRMLEVEVVSITEFGVFVRIEGELEGLVFANEIEKEVMDKLKPGDKIKVKVIKVDIEQAKIGLSAKV
jgi:small subunit ribosomal protein S1